MLRRYPVKSMLGETVTELDVTVAGVMGDRAFAVLDDQTGRIASAKNPRLWRDLLTVTATTQGRWTQFGAPPRVDLTLPDGRVYEVCDPVVHKELGAILGRGVTLLATPFSDALIERAVPSEVLHHGPTADVAVHLSRLGVAAGGGFVDYGPVHLITTATLRRIGLLASQRDSVSAHRYRPNIVLELPGEVEGFAENDWTGLLVRIGPEVVLEVLLPTPRCAVPTLAHGRLPRDTTALSVIAHANRVATLGGQPCAGCYASVVSPGRICGGDTVLVG